MLKWLEIIARTIWSTLRSHQALAIENLALRQQLAVFKYRHPRPRLTDADRLFWVVMSQIWVDWRESLHIVQPETVVRWHRQGFRYYWRWKSRRRGRPRIDPEIRHLIRRMCRANPLWGAPRIHGELLKLGIDVSKAAVSKYMIRRRGPPSQTWRTFLSNHAKDIIALDFFTVPTATFRILFVLIILSHDRRRILHVNVTEHPTAAWTALQLLGVRVGRGATISAARSRRHLRRNVSPADRCAGDQRGHDRTTITLAESLCRKGHRLHTQGMFGSHDYSG